MGATPSSNVKKHDEQGLREVFGHLSPEELQYEHGGAMKDVLVLNLDALCQIYHNLAVVGREAVRLTDAIAVGLSESVMKRLLGQRTSTSVAELLTFLVVASHTGALTKVRFMFSIYERTGQGVMRDADFLDAAFGLLTAACCLARAPRARWPNLIAVDMLVSPLLRQHGPEMKKENFVNAVMAQGCVWQMLKRFARGAPDANFVLTMWAAAPRFLAIENACQLPIRGAKARSAAPRTPDREDPVALSPGNQLEKKRNAAPAPGPPSAPNIKQRPAPPTAGPGRPPSASSAAGWPPAAPPAKGRPPSAATSTGSPPSTVSARTRPPSASFGPSPSSDKSASVFLRKDRPLSAAHAPGSRSGRPQSSRSAFAQKTSSKLRQASSIGAPEDIPRRHGYFMAMHQPAEDALIEELCSLQRQRKQRTATGATKLADLDIREEELRKELREKIHDETTRRDYRQQLEEMRRNSCGQARVTRGGRFWTLSREHVKRGGEVPMGVIPVTPESVQAYVLNNGGKDAARPTTASSRAASRRFEAESEVSSPVSAKDASRTKRVIVADPTQDEVPKTAAADSTECVDAFALGSVEAKKRRRGEDVEEDGSEAEDRESSDEKESKAGTATSNIRVKLADVLLAFERFRQDYWIAEGYAALVPRDGNREHRRDEDIDAIFAIPWQLEPPSAAVSLLSSQAMTLRSYLKILWPSSTPGDLKMMMRWIAASKRKPEEENKVTTALETQTEAMHDLFHVVLL